MIQESEIRLKGIPPLSDDLRPLDDREPLDDIPCPGLRCRGDWSAVAYAFLAHSNCASRCDTADQLFVSNRRLLSASGGSGRSFPSQYCGPRVDIVKETMIPGSLCFADTGGITSRSGIAIESGIIQQFFNPSIP
jgi:hypothetical protein